MHSSERNYELIVGMTAEIYAQLKGELEQYEVDYGMQNIGIGDNGIEPIGGRMVDHRIPLDAPIITVIKNFDSILGDVVELGKRSQTPEDDRAYRVREQCYSMKNSLERFDRPHELRYFIWIVDEIQHEVERIYEDYDMEPFSWRLIGPIEELKERHRLPIIDHVGRSNEEFRYMDYK